MPDWLLEGNWSLLILIGLAAGLCGMAWTKTAKKLWLGLAVALAGFLGMLLLLDWWFESDREQIDASVHAMAAAVAPHDFNGIFSHIAGDFRYGTVNKSEFRRMCESNAKTRGVRGMTVWGVRVLSVDRAKGEAVVSFQFKIKADALADANFFNCQGNWVKERDGRWRLRTFRVYPLSTADQPVVIPGIG